MFQKPPPTAEVKMDQEEGFRAALEDLVSVADRMQYFCGSIPEMLTLAKLALENETQLKFLMKVVLNVKTK